MKSGIGKNTLVGMATDGTVFGLGILVSVVLARNLGAEGRGIYVLLTTTNILLANIGHLSVLTACSTLLARGRYSLGQVNTIALLLALTMGLLCIVVTTLAYPLLRQSIFPHLPYSYLLIALLLTPIAIYQAYWNYMMIGLNRIVTLNKLTLGVNMGSALLMILLVGILKLGIPGFLAVWAFSASAGLVGALVVTLRLERLAWPPSRAALKEMLGFGLRTHGANIAHYLFLRFDAYAVNSLISSSALGIYSISTSLAEKLWLPLNSLQASSMSQIAQLPRGESALLTAKIARTALMLMLGLAIPFAAVSPWLIPFMYGAEFAGAVLPLIVLLGGTIAFALMLALNNYILGQMERPGLLSIVSGLELVLSIPLYLLLIRSYGILGAAVASTATYLLALVMTLFIFLHDSGLPLRRVLIPQLADFQNYVRVIRAAMLRVPGLARYAGRIT